MRRLPVCLLWSALVISPAAAWVSPAPDVVLYCPAALEGALDQVAARYTSATHVPVHVFTGTAYRLQGLLKHRARADVVVADARAVQDWAAGGLVRADTVTPVGRNAYVLVARSDADWPHAVAATLLTDHAAVLTDPTTAAEFDGAAILHAAVPQNTARSIGVADTTTVLERVRADGALLGVVQQTEAATPLIHTVAVLSAPPEPLAGAIVTQGQSGSAPALLSFITGPDGQAILRQAGLETGS
jgi:ABC-type molybdate transport system substrate-binding protein